MRTKQVTDQEMHDVATDKGGPRTTQHAEDTSRQLLAEARYDAFRLMTEARGEAETILSEARAEAGGTKKAAEITAASSIEKAEREAAAIIESAQEEAASVVAGAHRSAGENPDQSEDTDALEAEHKALSERVSTLRTLANQLEDRFALLASTAATHPAESDEPSDIAAVSHNRGPVVDYSASVAASPKTAEKQDPDSPDGERRSFYHRRSAKLPRLENGGGQGALDMARSMRQSLDSD